MSGSLSRCCRSVTVAGGNFTIVAVVALIAVAALGVAWVLAREVLAASEGTDEDEGDRRRRAGGRRGVPDPPVPTLAVFAVIVVSSCYFLLPADDHDTTSRSAARSSSWSVRSSRRITGYIGMWLAVRGNVRVAAAASEDGRRAARRCSIAFRTGGVAGMFTVGLGLLRCRGRRAHLQGRTPRPCSRASASVPRCSPCSCVSAAASSPRRPTSAPTWSARSSRASPRTTRATRRRSPTTSATTSATAPAWRPTCSSPTP